MRNRNGVELDLTGTVTERARVEGVLPATYLAVFTADDHVFLQGNCAGEVYTFDHSSKTWKPIPKQGTGFLMGAEGEHLVYDVLRDKPGPIQLEWYWQPDPGKP